MTTEKATAQEWQSLQTDDSRLVEELLRQHFASVDVYRYNSASLRVRIVDPIFKGKSREQRDDLVEPFLSQLDENIQRDIMNLVMMYPDEENESHRIYINNAEFEHPSSSML